MYHIGPKNTKGTFFFHAPMLQGWVVADLDTGKTALHNKLATILVDSYGGVEDVLEARTGLGQDDNKWLVDGDELVPLLRDYSEDVEVLMVFNQDGTETPYGVKEREAAKIAKKYKKEK